jgi:RNA exonuclease NGL2
MKEISSCYCCYCCCILLLDDHQLFKLYIDHCSASKSSWINEIRRTKSKMNTRKWLTLDNNNHNEQQEEISSFTIMQYNVLAQALINRRTRFHYCTKKAGRWSHRKQNLLQEVLLYNPTILCMQECDYYTEHWKSALSQNGYDSVYSAPKKRKDMGDDNTRYGIVTAFKTSDFQLLYSDVIQFQDYLWDENYSSVFEKSKSQFDVMELDKATNCAHILCLKHVSGKYALLVANSHLAWRPDFKYTRLRQVHILMNRMKQIQKQLIDQYKFDNIPIIFSCDLNDLPHNPIYTLLTNESREPVNVDSEQRSDALQLYLKLKYKIPDCILSWNKDNINQMCTDSDIHLETLLLREMNIRMEHVQSIIDHTLAQDFPVFTSVYSSYMKFFPDATSKYKVTTNESYGVVTGGEYEPVHTNYVEGFKETLDYIFIERGSRDRIHIIPKEILAIPSDETLSQCTALPNEEFSSDHISLACKLSVVTRNQ